MKRILLGIIPLLCFYTSVSAQMPAGTAFKIGYNEFTGDQTIRYINCGNDESLNPGQAITIECWARSTEVPTLTNNNMKILGKVNGSFDSGWMMGMETGIYGEIWNPSVNTIQSGVIPDNETWAHLAITFNAGGKMKGYVNGIQVLDEIELTDTAIGANDSNLIIGVAPWDLANFQYWGEMDEVRIWNRALTKDEIRARMHVPLSGDENNLISYYDFDDVSGNTVPDEGPSGNDGTMVNGTANSWVFSSAVIGDDVMKTMNDVVGLWQKNLLSSQSSNTDGGMNMSLPVEGTNYAVFGHDGNSGLQLFEGASAPPNTMQTARGWYVNEVSEGTDLVATLEFDLEDAAGGGEMLNPDHPVDHYTLTFANPGFASVELLKADSKNGNTIVFDNVVLNSGYYFLAAGDAPFSTISGIADQAQAISTYPNPVQNDLFFDLPASSENTFVIYNLSGAVAKSNLVSGNHIEVSDLPTGQYILELKTSEGRMVNKFFKL